MNGVVQILVNGEVATVHQAWWFAMRGPAPPFNYHSRDIMFTFKGYVIWPATRVFHYQVGRPTWKPFRNLARNLYALFRFQGCGRIKSFILSAKGVYAILQ